METGRITDAPESTRHALSGAGALRLGNVPRATMNVLFVGLYLLLAVSSFVQFTETGSLRSLGILAVNTLFAGLLLFRRPATAETGSAAVWLLATAGTTLPFLLRPADFAGPVVLGRLGIVLQMSGLVLLAMALLSLGRSFSVVPSNRGIRDAGLYRIVRHPVYMAELVLVLGLVLSNPTVANALIWVAECVLQFSRARAEEGLLSEDPAYRAYLGRVRYRLIPSVL